VAVLLAAAAFAACGNYSNEDLEFMNAVPARQDFVASIPRDLMPANEAELAKDTHGVINTFNGALDFLKIADVIRMYPPTSRIPDGRIWGPAPDSNHAGWHLARACETARARQLLGPVSEQSLYNLLSRTVELEVLPASEFYGVGFLAWESIGKNDFPVVQAVVLVLAVIYIALTTVADLMNAVLDPRLRGP